MKKEKMVKSYYQYWGKTADPLKIAYCVGQDKQLICEQYRSKIAFKAKILESQVNILQLEKLAKKEKWHQETDLSSYHLLPYHCLDVAAVGEVLLNANPFLRKRFEQLFKIPENQLIPWLKLLLTLHDCGKFAESFQQLQPQLRKAWWGEIKKTNYDLRHDSLGFLLWEDSKLIKQTLNISPRDYRKSLKIWLQAVTGHHGLPPSYKEAIIVKDYFQTQDVNSTTEFFSDLTAFFDIETTVLKGHLNNKNWEKQQQQASWLLAGFTILCDWLGSDSDIFKFCNNESLSLDEYWQHYALPSAKKVVDNSGLIPAKAAKKQSLSALFPIIKTSTPLQKQAENLTLTNNPQLFILEDVTGAGKTEAAMMLAHRLISEKNLAQGVFIGLPTMATTNAMYSRAATCYLKLFTENSFPSLILAHSARHLSKQFKQSIFESSLHNRAYNKNDPTASAQCTQWLSDHNKKSLLADIGIGTIDQALLSILPARHQALRLFGLANKVLIIDEVHAYDTYMSELLSALLNFHAALGGSVILLSATLSFEMRSKLVKAFQQGANYPAMELNKRALSDYPLLTHISENAPIETVVETRAEVERDVKVNFYHEKENLITVIKKAVMTNLCVTWICNTVFDAREVYAELQKMNEINNEQLFLFHSRYTLHDRKKVEETILELFGRNSTAQSRQGKIVIATQVIEQSLDLDFDVMITDLAPIDLLIQRAGRLHRHIRDENGNPIKGIIDGRKQPPVLNVFSPPITQQPKANWYKRLFPKANGVYPHTGQLWRTALLLAKKQSWKMPDDARELIETVYQSEEEGIPETLIEASRLAEGESWAKKSIGKMNVLNYKQGYSMENKPWDEENNSSTRLAEDSNTVYLAQWKQGKFEPYVKNAAYCWDLSSLKISSYHLKTIPVFDEAVEKALKKLRQEERVFNQYSLILPLFYLSATQWKSEVINQADKKIAVVYCQQLGFLVAEEAELILKS